MSVVLGPKKAAAGVPGDRDAVWEAYIPPASADEDGALTVKERRGSPPVLLVSDEDLLAAAPAAAASGSRVLIAQKWSTQGSHTRFGGA